MTQLIKSGLDRVPVIDTEGHIDWQSRLIITGEEYGFFPTSLNEIAQVANLVNYLGTPRSTIQTLNEILWHQKNHGYDGALAVRSVTQEFGLYHEDAFDRAQRLSELATKLIDVNPEITVELSDAAEDRGLLDLLQFIEVRKAAETGDNTPLKGGVTKRGEKREKVLASHYDQSMVDSVFLGVLVSDVLRMTVHEARLAAADAATSQQNRQQFWHERIEESQKHGAARLAAKEILAKLAA